MDIFDFIDENNAVGLNVLIATQIADCHPKEELGKGFLHAIRKKNYDCFSIILGDQGVFDILKAHHPHYYGIGLRGAVFHGNIEMAEDILGRKDIMEVINFSTPDTLMYCIDFASKSTEGCQALLPELINQARQNPAALEWVQIAIGDHYYRKIEIDLKTGAFTLKGQNRPRHLPTDHRLPGTLGDFSPD